MKKKLFIGLITLMWVISVPLQAAQETESNEAMQALVAAINEDSSKANVEKVVAAAIRKNKKDAAEIVKVAMETLHASKKATDALIGVIIRTAVLLNPAQADGIVQAAIGVSPNAAGIIRAAVVDAFTEAQTGVMLADEERTSGAPPKGKYSRALRGFKGIGVLSDSDLMGLLHMDEEGEGGAAFAPITPNDPKDTDGDGEFGDEEGAENNVFLDDEDDDSGDDDDDDDDDDGGGGMSPPNP